MLAIIRRTASHRAALLLLATALSLAACGSTESAQGDAPASEEGDAGTDADDDAGDGDDGGDTEAAPAEELAAEDGFNGPLDADGPTEPGTAILRVPDEEVELTLECLQPGPLDDHGYLLFHFSASAEGELADGRRVTVSAERQILDAEEAAKSVYDYKGQESATFQVTVEADEGFHSSIVVSPGDSDPTGSELPVVRVTEDGAFSAVHDLEALSGIHDTALEGPSEFAGTCQGGWDEQA